MNYNDNEASVTISRQRYAELVIAEADAERLKAIIRQSCNNYHALSHAELKVMRDLFSPEEEVELKVMRDLFSPKEEEE